MRTRRPCASQQTRAGINAGCAQLCGRTAPCGSVAPLGSGRPAKQPYGLPALSPHTDSPRSATPRRTGLRHETRGNSRPRSRHRQCRTNRKSRTTVPVRVTQPKARASTSGMSAYRQVRLRGGAGVLTVGKRMAPAATFGGFFAPLDLCKRKRSRDPTRHRDCEQKISAQTAWFRSGARRDGRASRTNQSCEQQQIPPENKRCRARRKLGNAIYRHVRQKNVGAGSGGRRRH